MRCPYVDVGHAQSVPGCGEDLECQIGDPVSVRVAFDQPVSAGDFDPAQFPRQTREDIVADIGEGGVAWSAKVGVDRRQVDPVAGREWTGC